MIINYFFYDPSKRWYFFVLAKTWVFTCVGLVFMMLLCAASPYLRDRLVRGANGDTRTHQITIFFTGSRVVSDDMYGKRLSLYDSSGFVGEIRNVGCTETIQNGKLINSRIWLRVSTDRQDALDRNRKEYTVDIRPNGLLYIQD